MRGAEESVVVLLRGERSQILEDYCDLHCSDLRRKLCIAQVALSLNPVTKQWCSKKASVAGFFEFSICILPKSL